MPIAAIAGGVRSSGAIDPAYRVEVSREVKAQASAVEFGAPLVSAQPLTVSERVEVKRLADDATVRADRTALLFTVLFTAIGFLLKSRLPNTRNVEREEPLVPAVH